MLKARIISNQMYRNAFVQMAQGRSYARLSVKIVFISNLWSVDYYPTSIGRDGLLTVTLFPVSHSNACTTYRIVLTKNSSP